jgi:hypothetical protein
MTEERIVHQLMWSSSKLIGVEDWRGDGDIRGELPVVVHKPETRKSGQAWHFVP